MARDFLRIFAAALAGGLLWVNTIPDYGWSDLVGAVIIFIVFATRPSATAVSGQKP